jgi:hypothetical protein
VQVGCPKSVSAYQPLSEHALANTLDVSEFVLASGEHITVLDSWPKVVSTPPVPVPKEVRFVTYSGRITRR